MLCADVTCSAVRHLQPCVPALQPYVIQPATLGVQPATLCGPACNPMRAACNPMCSKALVQPVVDTLAALGAALMAAGAPPADAVLLHERRLAEVSS